MKVLIISQFFPPEMGAAASRIHGLSKWLQTEGVEIQVLTAMPNYPKGRIYDAYRDKLFISEYQGDVATSRSWLYTSERLSTSTRVLSYLSFVLTASCAALKLHRHFDLVIVTSPPLFVGLVGFLLNKLYRKKWVLDVRDLCNVADGR